MIVNIIAISCFTRRANAKARWRLKLMTAPQMRIWQYTYMDFVYANRHRCNLNRTRFIKITLDITRLSSLSQA